MWRAGEDKVNTSFDWSEPSLWLILGILIDICSLAIAIWSIIKCQIAEWLFVGTCSNWSIAVENLELATDWIEYFRL